MGRGRLGSLFVDDEEDEMLLVPRRMERTLCSLLGGVEVAATGGGLEASTKRSSLLTCCCFTSKRDCSVRKEKQGGQRRNKTIYTAQNQTKNHDLHLQFPFIILFSLFNVCSTTSQTLEISSYWPIVFFLVKVFILWLLSSMWLV